MRTSRSSNSVQWRTIRDFVIFAFKRTQREPRRHLRSRLVMQRLRQRIDNLPRHVTVDAPGPPEGGYVVFSM